MICYILLPSDNPATGVCTVTVVHQLSAELVIDTNWKGVFEPGFKTINDTRYVRLIVEKIAEETSHDGWRIIPVTAAEHMLSSGEQEVHIS